MILHPSEDGFVAIPQSAHAFIAFQIAEHWGNRFTPRPSPRAEVLAAVLLHDAGWDGNEEPPRLTSEGIPLAFDTVSDAEREKVWTSAVERAHLRGRYVAYLVSHHVSTLASFNQEHRFDGFLARQEALRLRLEHDLRGDARYGAVFATESDHVNRAVVRLADAIAVHLARGGKAATFHDLPRRGGTEPLAIKAVGARTYRLRPWPFIGTRLAVTTEGRMLPMTRFPGEDALRAAWAESPTVRLTWTMLSSQEHLT